MTSGSNDAPLEREVVPWGTEPWKMLQEDWGKLALSSDAGSAFTSVRWVEAWMEVFGPTYRPMGLLWRVAGDVVGCALIPVRRVRVGPFRVTRAYLNASGPVEALCEHNDLLVEEEHRSAVLEDLLRFLLDEGKIEELSLVGVRRGTAEEISRRWPVEAWNGFTSEAPYVSLELVRENDGDYLRELSSNKRSQIRRSIRLYEEIHGPPSVAEPASEEQAVSWFEEMVSLHVESWRARGERGAFPADGVRFHSTLVRRCFRTSEEGLRATLLRIRFGEETIGVLYFLEHRGRVNFYQSGLSYSDDSKLKPGLVAHTLAVRHFAERGATEYDFLGGEAETARYKRSLSTDSRDLVWCDLPSSASKMRLLAALRRGRRWLRSRISS